VAFSYIPHSDWEVLRSVKWLYLLKGVLCCHNSCAIFKPLHCISVQSAIPNQHVSLSTRRELRQKYLEIMVSFHCVLLVFIARPAGWPKPAKINYVHYDRDFVEAISFAFNPPPPGAPTRRIVVKPCTDRKLKNVLVLHFASSAEL
jgi:hypothetical protein